MASAGSSMGSQLQQQCERGVPLPRRLACGDQPASSARPTPQINKARVRMRILRPPWADPCPRCKLDLHRLTATRFCGTYFQVCHPNGLGQAARVLQGAGVGKVGEAGCWRQACTAQRKGPAKGRS